MILLLLGWQFCHYWQLNYLIQSGWFAISVPRGGRSFRLRQDSEVKGGSDNQ